MDLNILSQLVQSSKDESQIEGLLQGGAVASLTSLLRSQNGPTRQLTLTALKNLVVHAPDKHASLALFLQSNTLSLALAAALQDLSASDVCLEACRLFEEVIRSEPAPDTLSFSFLSLARLFVSGFVPSVHALAASLSLNQTAVAAAAAAAASSAAADASPPSSGISLQKLCHSASLAPFLVSVISKPNRQAVAAGDDDAKDRERERYSALFISISLASFSSDSRSELVDAGILPVAATLLKDGHQLSLHKPTLRLLSALSTDPLFSLALLRSPIPVCLLSLLEVPHDPSNPLLHALPAIILSQIDTPVHLRKLLLSSPLAVRSLVRLLGPIANDLVCACVKLIALLCGSDRGRTLLQQNGAVAALANVTKDAKKPKNLEQAISNAISSLSLPISYFPSDEKDPFVLVPRKTSNYMTEKISHELLETERNYVEALDAALTVFYPPLAAEAEGNPFPMISSSDLKGLFSNLHAIYGVHTDFLSKLERYHQLWPNSETSIGVLLLDLVKSLKIYNLYIQNFGNAHSINERVARAQPRYVEFMKTCAQDPKTRSRSLMSHLIQPIQRIPRYILLLEDLYKYSNKATSDEWLDLQLALAELRSTADFLNEAKRNFEMMSKVAQIQEERLLSETNFVVPGRLFCLEGDLIKMDSRTSTKGKPFRAFLFTDLLLLALPKKGKFRPKHEIDLTDCVVRRLDDQQQLLPMFSVRHKIEGAADVEHLFVPALSTDPNEGDTGHVKTPALDSRALECSNWFNLLQRNVREQKMKLLNRANIVQEKAKGRNQRNQTTAY